MEVHNGNIPKLGQVNDVPKVGPCPKILNHTFPLPSQVAAVLPLGTFAKYSCRGPGWEMDDLAVNPILEPAATVAVEVPVLVEPSTLQRMLRESTDVTGPLV